MKKPEITTEQINKDKYFLLPYSDNEIYQTFTKTNDILLKQTLKLELIRRKTFLEEMRTLPKNKNIFNLK